MNEIEKNYLRKCEIPSDINELLPVLKKYAEFSDSVTEMGVRSIVSTWAFLAAGVKKLTSIDLYHPSFFISHDNDGCNLDLVQGLASENGIDFKFIQGNTLEIEIENCDLLFIDTLHDYLQLKTELLLHSSKVKKYIIFHDTETFGTKGESKNSEGIIKAIDEFLDSNKEWKICQKITQNNGLVVIEKRK
jgi:hypothetical protein